MPNAGASFELKLRGGSRDAEGVERGIEAPRWVGSGEGMCKARLEKNLVFWEFFFRFLGFNAHNAEHYIIITHDK